MEKHLVKKAGGAIFAVLKNGACGISLPKTLAIKARSSKG